MGGGGGGGRRSVCLSVRLSVCVFAKGVGGGDGVGGIGDHAINRR